MDITKEMANIDAYLFKYNKKAQEIYGGEKGVDDKEHIGVMAQELAENPVTSATVESNEDGILEVNAEKLCLTLAAVVSELCKKVGELEFEIKMIKGGE